jgi:hypothetical protein
MRFIVLVLLAVLSANAAAQVSSGTAFAIAPELLITNQHVIDGCGSVEIITSDGRRVATVVDANSQIDLALLRVSGIKGATARLRNPRNIRLGESVMVFGFPLAGSLTSGGNFTSGLVSGLRGLKDAPGEIQITAPVQQGNSGGPLMDASGLVIGVVQAKLDAVKAAIATGDIPQNVNFAISLDVLADFLAKNRVVTRDGALATPLDTARVAQLAQSFTYRVDCRGGTQKAVVSPSNKSEPPTSASTNREQQYDPVATVAKFYKALSLADGETASSLVIPEIRKGTFDGKNIENFFGSMKVPLKVDSIRQLDRDIVEVKYTYRHTNSQCSAVAIVETTFSLGNTFIKRIRANC